MNLKKPEMQPLWSRAEVDKICDGTWIVPPAGGFAVHGFTYYPNQIKSGFLALTTSAPSWSKKSFADTTGMIKDFFARGAAAVITDRRSAAKDCKGPVLLVKDTRETLDKFGHAARERMTGKVICVTGSAGKTSTKDALGFVLGRQALSFAAPRSRNTHYGAPLHLAQTPPLMAYAVYEAAVSTVEGISGMARMIRPHVGLITNIHENHLDVHLSTNGLALAKAKIFSCMASGGIAVLNRDDEQFATLAKAAAGYGVLNIITFGVHQAADVRLVSLKMDAMGSDVEAEIFGRPLRYRTSSPGRSFAANSLGILAGVRALGADVEKAAAALAEFTTLPGRGKVHVLPLAVGTFQLMDDSFNATPVSMKAGFETSSLLAVGPGGRRIAMLGDIGHLGQQSKQIHRDLAKAVDDYKFDRLFTIGDEMRHLHDAAAARLQTRHAQSLDELYAAVLAYLRAGDVVYAKGSLSVKFRISKVVDNLLDLKPAGSPIKFLSADYLAGANRYAVRPVMARTLTFGKFASLRSGQAGQDFAKRLLDRLPLLGKTQIEGEKAGAFMKRLLSPLGAPLAEVVLQAILALEERLDEKDIFAKVLKGDKPSERRLVFSSLNPDLSRRSSRLALRLVGDLLFDNLKWEAGVKSVDFKGEERALRAQVKQYRLHPDDARLGEAAKERDIPWEMIGNRVALLGQGKLQKRIRSSVTSETSHSAAMIAGDKNITNRILGGLFLPVPHQEVVDSEASALDAARKIGFPVAVKPLGGSEGLDVSANLAASAEVSGAFARAARDGQKVIVESFIKGDDHRLLVVGGRLLAAAKKIPPSVTGDGQATIRDLIKKLNDHPSRDGRKLFKVKIGDDLMRLLAASGRALDDVLKVGEKMVLCSTANFSTGGIPIDVTDKVHPDNQSMAVRAALAVGLDVAGIDFVTPDIARSYKEIGGAIIEVNALPGLRLHYWPAEGQARDVTGPIIDLMFPPGANSRIPIAVLSGAVLSGAVLSGCSGLDFAAHALAHILQQSGQCVGLSSQEGVFIDGKRLDHDSRPLRGYQAAQTILRDPRVEVMVRTASPGEIVDHGLGHDACQVMAILNASKDGDKADAAKAAKAELGLSIARGAARGMIIVNADDKAAIELAGKISYHRLAMVSRGAKNAALRRHIGIGGDAILLENKSTDPKIALYVKGRLKSAFPVKDIPALSGHNNQTALIACLYGLALAHGLGMTFDAARRALRTFSLDALQHPVSARPVAKPPSLAKRVLWTAKELALATGGEWISLPDGFQGVDDVSFFWSTAKPGDLVIITTKKQWGPSFKNTINKASAIFKAGAAALMTSVKPKDMRKNKWPVLWVDNTHDAIWALAKTARDRFQGKVICITGSVGKSSAKEALAYVLGRQGQGQETVFKTPKNFNSSSGVPLSLCKTPDDCAFAIYEFSIGRPPDRLLQKTKLARPHVGIITQVQPDHLLYWGNVDNVADAKSQLFDGLEPGGTAVLYHGMMRFDRVLANVRQRKIANIIVYGLDPSCDVRLVSCEYGQDGSQVTASVRGEEVSYRVCLPGRHVVINSLAVLAGVLAAGADWRHAANDLKTAPWPQNRGQCFKISIPGGYFTLIDDAYSANSESMLSAFDLLSLIMPGPGGRRMAALGEINELGETSKQIHAELAKPLMASSVDLVFTLGDDLLAMRERLPGDILGLHGKSANDIAEAVASKVRPGDVVLVKGSERRQDATDIIIKRLKELDKGGALSALVDAGEAKLVKVVGKDRGAGQRLEVLFAGDTALCGNYRNYLDGIGGKNLLEAKGHDFFMAKVKDIAIGADVAIVNLETPLTSLEKSPFAGKKTFIHWADLKKMPKFLRRRNIRVVSLANNHAFDFGDDGFRQTLQVLRDHKIMVIGAGENQQDATAPLVIDAELGTGRFRLAVLASFDASKAYRQNFVKEAGQNAPGLDLLNVQRIAKQAKVLKAADPEMLIVAFPHWGENYQWRTKDQDSRADLLLAAGVDLIIGHGAHMLQEIDCRKGRFVVFSLGNFVFNSPGRYEKMLAPPFSLAAKLTTLPDNRGVSVVLRLYPIVTDNKQTSYQTRFVADDEFTEVKKQLLAHGSDFEQANERVRFCRDRLGPFIELDVARKDNFRPAVAKEPILAATKNDSYRKRKILPLLKGELEGVFAQFAVTSPDPSLARRGKCVVPAPRHGSMIKADGIVPEPIPKLGNDQKPAVPINQSFGAEGIICLEDGKSFKSLALHLKKAHGMKPGDYRKKWGLAKDYPLTVYKAKKKKS